MVSKEKLIKYYAKRWTDPVLRIQDIFNVRKASGELIPLKVPHPQRQILRDGILGNGRALMKKGQVINRIINKGRQIGYSIISAAEAILIAEDYPKTFQYYVATKEKQAIEWLEKLQQLVQDANCWPKELGGTPIIRTKNIRPQLTKTINDCSIVGLPYNPGGMRGSTAINVILDEMAWMIMYKNQQEETYAACKHFVSQGGQLTCQSTPRSQTDKFMEFYVNPEKHGFKNYYCPTITNWQTLDLNEPFIIEMNDENRREHALPPLTIVQKQELINKYSKKTSFIIDTINEVIKQDVKCPYSWKNLHELEKDRRSDVEIFKQENLGVAIDERYKVLNSEWIYQNLTEKELSHRGDSMNQFVFGIDIAKQQDLFVITIFEVIDDHWFNRYTEIMPVKQNYVISAHKIVELYDNFLPTRISVDNTGGGIVFCDILETMKVKNVLQRVTFNQSSKTNLAETLRSVARDNKLHMLNNTDEHKLIIRHLLKVERQQQETHTKYTGKEVDKEGRDDGFWSTALAICANPHRDNKEQARLITASFGSVNARVQKDNVLNNQYSLTKKMINKNFDKPNIEVNEILDEENKVYKLVFNKLKTGMLPCPKNNGIVNPLDCVNCERTNCIEYSYHDQTCKDFQVNKTKFREYLKTKNWS
jgi:phage FluMu gp28-like protein